jgi:PAS domain S-box-containing protein
MKPRKNSSSVGLKLIRTAALLIWVVMSLLPSVGRAQQSAAPKRVLVLYWYNKDFPFNVRFDQSFQAALQSAPAGTVEYYPEYLETNRFPGENQSLLLRDYLRQRYADRTMDVVVASGYVTLDFLLKYRDDLFPHTPIVFLLGTRPTTEELAARPGLTGIITLNAYRKTLDLALRLHPGTEQVFVISGTLQRDKKLETMARKELQVSEGRVRINYLTDLPPDELIAKTKSLPGRSIVLYVWQQSQTEQGEVLEFLDILGLIARSAPVPIYGMNSLSVGKGLVGGYVYTPETSATRVAEIALQIANGARPQDIPVENAPIVPMFDWRELRRWGISEGKLPPGSIVLLKEPTFWEQYKGRVIATLAVIAVQTLLIGFLLLERRRRQRTTLDLRKSEEQFRQLFENSKDAILITDDDGNCLQVNQAACDLLCYTREQFLRMKITDLLPADAPLSTTNFRSYLKTGFEAGEWSFFRFDGERRTTLYTACRFAPGLNLCILHDFTERKRTEDALRESEVRYRQMFERNRAVKLLIDPTSGAIVKANPAAAEFYGYSLDELEGKLITDINILEEAQVARELALAATEQCSYFVFRHRLASGEVRDVEVHSSPLDVEGRRLLYSIIHDITERRRTEERLRQFFDLPLVGMAITSPDRYFLLVNQKLCDMLGYREHELTGKTWVDVTHPEDIAENTRLLEQTLRGETEGYSMDKRFFHRDGHVVYTTISARCVRRDDGSVDHMVLIVMDISERKHAEQSLRQAFTNIKQLKEQLQAENVYLQEEFKLNHSFNEIIGESKELKYVFHKVEQVAIADTTVLLLGETGTGKELVARAIHRSSPRKDRPFIKVNCAALPATLIESELFGHEKGAFTGAHARKLGRFELANEGTLLLDEVGELPLELQNKLLRVLQEGEFERLGGSQTIKVNVRIIAATNRNMKMEIQNGLFREDLWYRLSVFPITLPPLRHRKDDIPLLVNHFVNIFSKKLGKQLQSIAPGTMKALRDYTWPGNIREFANVIERAMINARGPVLYLAEKLDSSPTLNAPSFNGQSLAEMERDIILQRLEETNWKIEGPAGAAQSLGLKPSTLRQRMAKFGIQRSNAQH